VPTKVDWDWSQAGQDREEDPHVYLKIKGEFVYESEFLPTYLWYNGTADRYLLGDVMYPKLVTVFNQPLGNIDDINSKIFPFKAHTGQQPYDSVNNYFVQPQTVGKDGYWTHFDWQIAIQNGMDYIGLPYSGKFDFAPTLMYWPTTHMVQPAENALQCEECHSENGRLDWIALGYQGDPIDWGVRFDD
jgi:hypothetical protein